MTDHAIGIDIGGTKIAAGVVALDTGCVASSSMVSTPVGAGGEAVLHACVDLVSALDPAGSLPVGVAVPELVGLDGRIRSAYQFDWRETDVRAAFAGREVAIESDVRAAAQAEARSGAGRGSASMLYVTIGTGISSTLVIDGSPWRGARGNALVLSSGDLATIDPATGSVVRSVLEELASGPALVERYEASGGQAGIGTTDLLTRAANGDALAARVVGNAAEALGSAIGQAVNLLDPDLVVVGGGLGLAGGSWWDGIVAATRRSIWSDETRALPIVTAQLGVSAGVVGAAMAVGMTR